MLRPEVVASTVSEVARFDFLLSESFMTVASVNRFGLLQMFQHVFSENKVEWVPVKCSLKLIL